MAGITRKNLNTKKGKSEITSVLDENIFGNCWCGRIILDFSMESRITGISVAELNMNELR